MSDDLPEVPGQRDEKGRFRPGVSGHPGSAPHKRGKHLRDAILSAGRKAGLKLDPEAAEDEGLEVYLEQLAIKDSKAFASLLGRVLPTLPVRVALPEIRVAADLVEATSKIAKAAADGEISASDASALGSVLGHVAKAVELHSLAERLERLEAAMGDRK